MVRRRVGALRLLKWGGALLCLILGGLWAAGCSWTVVYYRAASPSTLAGLGLDRGCITVTRFVSQAITRDSQWVVMRRKHPLVWLPARVHAGRLNLWRVPLWPPLPPLAWLTLWAWRAHRRARLGQCRRCGYDMAGLPEGNRCPECGRGPKPARGALRMSAA